jgi:heterodisulfide reductase subunit A
MVEVTINGKKVKAKKRAFVIHVAEKAGITIPTLCHHEQLEPYGACRLCTVEATKGRRTRFVTACNYPVDEGMVIETQTPRIIQIRKLIIESLLALNPDVKILKEYAREYRVKVPRFERGDEDCIKCYLCLRMCDEIVGANAICFGGRGVGREVLTPFDLPADTCIACGACAWICPTNYLKMEVDKLEEFRSHPGRNRLCRYSLMGVTEGALCANSFRCWKCEVEQRFQDQLQTHPIFLGRARKMKEIDDFVNSLNDMRG